MRLRIRAKKFAASCIKNDDGQLCPIASPRGDPAIDSTAGPSWFGAGSGLCQRPAQWIP